MTLKKRWKEEKAWVLMAAFLLPALTLGVIYVVKGVYPFGDRAVLHIDMYHQYAPFFEEFRQRLQNGGSLMYSWNLGLGSDFLGTYAYYLASPLNLFLFFCPRTHLLEFMAALILIKTGFCGFSAAVYARGHLGTKSPAVLFPAVLYALSGYMAAYYWNVMWLDCVALFPLILLGMEMVIRRKKSGLFVVTFALSVWSNYYISFMIGVFLFLWFFIVTAEWRLPWRERVRSFLRVLAVSVLSGGVSAVLLIPEIRLLGQSGVSGDSFPDSLSWYFSAADGAGQFLFLSPVTTIEGELPNLFCGSAALFFCLLYLCNRRIRPCIRIAKFALLLFLLISFNLNALDFLWHGMHFPEGLPARQSFLCIFLVLMLAGEALLKRDGSRRTDALIAGAGCLALFVWIALAGKDEERLLYIAGTLLFLVAEALFFYLSVSGSKELRKVFFTAALVVVVAESAIHFGKTGFSTTVRSAYLQKLNDYQALTAAQREKDPSFYRTEKYERLMKDENCLSGYPAATLFSSLTNEKVADAYRSVGMEGLGNYYCYNGATPLLSSMLSVKYMLLDHADGDNPYRICIATKDGVFLYENTYVTPLGFLAPDGLAEDWTYGGQEERVLNVNYLGRMLGAGEDLMVRAGELQAENADAFFTPETDGYYFAEHPNLSAQSVDVLTERGTTTFSKTSHNYFLDLGYLRAGERVTLRASDDKAVAGTVYRISDEAVQSAVAALNENAMEMTAYSDTMIRGRIDAPEGKELVVMIPAEPGWTAKVDGEAAETGKFMNAFLTIPVTPGSHEILLTYRTPGIVPGAAVSLICLVLLTLLLWTERRRSAQERNLMSASRGIGLEK